MRTLQPYLLHVMMSVMNVRAGVFLQPHSRTIVVCVHRSELFGCAFVTVKLGETRNPGMDRKGRDRREGMGAPLMRIVFGHCCASSGMRTSCVRVSALAVAPALRIKLLWIILFMYGIIYPLWCDPSQQEDACLRS